MALIKTVVLPNGLTVDNAYIRIGYLEGNKDNITFQLMAYMNKQSYLEGKTIVQVETYSFTPSISVGSENFIRQAYLYLESLPAFIGVYDDLES